MDRVKYTGKQIYLPVILFSLVTSFIRAPRGSEVEEEEDGTATEASREVAEADAEPGGGGCWEVVEGVRRSWRDPSGGADRRSGGRWAAEEEVVVVGSTEDEGGADDPGRGGGEEETRFSLLSLMFV